MEFLASLPTFSRDYEAKATFEWFSGCIGDAEAICFYKYPFVGTIGTPDLVFLTRKYQPIIVKCFDYRIDQISSVSGETWELENHGEKLNVDPPSLVADDLAIDLKGRFERVRQLRRKISPTAVAALPRTMETEFFPKFGLAKTGNYLWAGGEGALRFLIPFAEELQEEEWRLARSILQTALPLTKNPGGSVKKTDVIGTAIRMLDSNIALLDDQQMKVAIQIPPGPQRIRGLAGTGKTVLLAMKAANIHKQFPDKRILFTFNTQSLYNQARNLVTRFYRFYSDIDPNWENLHVRHAWGGRSRPGVYYDLSQRQGSEFLNFSQAKILDYDSPFRACCVEAMKFRVDPYYDYVLVDEAQDFPKEFFPLLYKLAKEPKPLYWAYDELQSLVSLAIPDSIELFGRDAAGNPLVTLDSVDDDGMERDLVLLKSYRCPRDILMLAHALGLGIHNPRGAVQMLGDELSWRAVGYEKESGELKKGSDVTLYRDAENSPTLITEIYTGPEPLIRYQSFETREEELEWVAKSIGRDVKEQAVPPENIVVICLDSVRAKKYMISLQRLLFEENIGSTIPGLVDAASDFAEAGLVTLSTVFRAKGNEAPIVYIISFDHLYSFAEEIENRNRAFTSISRTKGWVRITGAGSQMKAVELEIKKILNDLPRFRFKFPDMDRIRKLDASETTRRRRQVKKVKEAVDSLFSSREALTDLSEEERKKLLNLLRGMTN
jgi:superfamily I DNA and RNA helicase